MSLILDALKKAEQDRHVGQAPVLDEMLVRPTHVVHRHVNRQPQDVALVAAIAAALLFAVAGILYWLWPSTMQKPAISTSLPAVKNAPIQVAPSGPTEPAHALRIDPERLSAPLADAPEEPFDVADTGASEASTMEDLENDGGQQSRSQRVLPIEPLPETPAATIVTTPPAAPSARPLKQMPPSFRNEFPKLVVDVHVYDDNPLRRFILVNGKKYREADALLEGPRVIEIAPDGVVVEHRGSQVLLELAR